MFYFYQVPTQMDNIPRDSDIKEISLIPIGSKVAQIVTLIPKPSTNQFIETAKLLLKL